MRTLSLDLRERILSAYDSHEGTRPEVARRFRVSLGMVKKLRIPVKVTSDSGLYVSTDRSVATLAIVFI